MKTKLLLLLCFLLSGTTLFAQQQNNPGPGFWLNNQPFRIPTAGNGKIELFPGDTLKLVLNTVNRFPGNVNNSIKVTSDFAMVLPGATFTVDNARQQTAFFYWVAPTAAVNFDPYLVRVTMKDNLQPIRGVYNFDLEIRVNETGSITLNNAPVNLTNEIVLQPGSLFNLKLSGVTALFGDSVSIASNAATVLPGATFSTNQAKQETATINWQPTAAHIRQNAYTFNLTLTKKSVPAKQYNYTVNVRVGNVMSVKPEQQQAAAFMAYPNPFTSEVHFRFEKPEGAEKLLIYNLLGQQVDEISVKGQSRDIRWEHAANQAAGTYIAKLVSADKTVQTLKFTKLQ